MSRPAIIAATDFTPSSVHAAGRAAMIARTLGARLILAHALPEADAPETDETASGPGETTPRAPGRLGKFGRKLRLLRHAEDPDAELQAAAQALNAGVDARLIYGTPGAALARLAADENAVLLVLGLHKERRVLDLLRLTTMERIVLDAAVPVLIAHRPPEAEYQCVLAPTDFSPASAAALAMAGRIAPRARFHAIHALQLPLGAKFSPGDAAADTAITRAEQLRTAFLAMPDLPPLSEPPEIVPGGVHEILAFRQNELTADLVCIGTHSGRDPSQLGNYARDLMRAPPTDLLVSKPL